MRTNAERSDRAQTQSTQQHDHTGLNRDNRKKEKEDEKEKGLPSVDAEVKEAGIGDVDANNGAGALGANSQAADQISGGAQIPLATPTTMADPAQTTAAQPKQSKKEAEEELASGETEKVEKQHAAADADPAETETIRESYYKLIPVLQDLIKVWRSNKEIINSIKSEDAIKAYYLVLHEMNVPERKKLSNEYPYLVSNMVDNLPASFQGQRVIGFTKGINTNKAQDSAESDADKMLAMLDKSSTWQDAGLLELVVSICVQGGLGPQLAEKLSSQNPEIRTSGLDAAGIAKNEALLTHFGITAAGSYEAETWKPGKKKEESSLLGMGMKYVFNKSREERKEGGTVRDGVILHMAGLNFLGGSKSQLEDFQLDTLQEGMGGHLKGVKFSSTDPKENKADGAKSIVDEFKDKDVDIEKAGFKHPDKLDTGAISYKADLENGKAFLLAASLPFEAINYASHDMTFRTTEGAFRKIFAEVKWTKPTKEDKTVPVTFDAYLGELEMNQLRIINELETYGMSKLGLNGLRLTITHHVEASQLKKGMDFMFVLMGMLMDTSFLLINMTMVAIDRMTDPASNAAKQGLTDSLTDYLYENLSASVSFDSLNIENFLATSMGHIGGIKLGKTSLDVAREYEGIQGQDTGKESLFDRKQGTDGLKEFEKKNKENKGSLLGERDKIKEGPDANAKIEELNAQINQTEQELKHERSKVGKEVGNHAYKVNLKTQDVAFTRAELISQQIASSFGDMLAEYGIYNPQGLADFTLNGQIDFSSLISGAEGAKKMVLEVDNVNFPEISAQNFSYTAENKFKLEGSEPVMTDVNLSCIHVEINEDASQDNLISFLNIDSVTIGTIGLTNLSVFEPANKKKEEKEQQSDWKQIMRYNTPSSINGFNQTNLSMIGDALSVGGVDFNFTPLKGNKQQNEVAYGGMKGSFDLEEIKVKYTEEGKKEEGKEESVKESKISLEGKIPTIGLSHLQWGKEGDELMIRHYKKDDFKGITLNTISFNIEMDEKENGASTTIKELKIDHLLLANTKLTFKGQDYIIDGIGSVKGLYLRNLVLEDRKEGEDTINTSKLEAGLQELQTEAFWMNLNRVKSLSTGSVAITSLPENQGMAVDIKNLQAPDIQSFERMSQDEKSKDYHRLKSTSKLGIGDKTDVSLQLFNDDSISVQIPKQLSLQEVHYQDQKGNSIHSNKKNPVTLQNFNVHFFIDPQGNILIKNLHLDRLMASGLEASMGDKSIKIPANKPASIENVNMEGFEADMAKGVVKGTATTGKLDLQALQVEVGSRVSNWLQVSPSLKLESLSFSGASDGAFRLVAENAAVGLNESPSKIRSALDIKNDSMDLAMHHGDFSSWANILQAEQIELRQMEVDGKLQKVVTLTNPILNEMLIKGAMLDGAKNPLFDLDALRLGGKIIGELTVLDKEDDIEIWADEAIMEKISVAMKTNSQADKQKEKNAKEENVNPFAFLDYFNGSLSLTLAGIDDEVHTMPIKDGWMNLADFIDPIIRKITNKMSDGLYSGNFGASTGYFNEYSWTEIKKYYGIDFNIIVENWAKVNDIKLVNDISKVKSELVREKDIIAAGNGEFVEGFKIVEKNYFPLSEIIKTLTTGDSKSDKASTSSDFSELNKELKNLVPRLKLQGNFAFNDKVSKDPISQALKKLALEPITLEFGQGNKDLIMKLGFGGITADLHQGNLDSFGVTETEIIFNSDGKMKIQNFGIENIKYYGPGGAFGFKLSGLRIPEYVVPEAEGKQDLLLRNVLLQNINFNIRK